MINGSPLSEYARSIDEAMPNATYMELWNLALETYKKNPYFFTQILLSDFRYRANHQKNIVASVESPQGTGKSLFSIAMCLWIGKLFDNAFILDRDIFINPSELDRDLRHGNNRRRTYLYDEQPQKTVGIGSYSTQISLKDYSEICRHTQNNLVYCSPEVLEHAHYFIFTQIFEDIKRVKNKACEKCEVYSKCQKTFYKTLCEIPFNKRDGYPIEFSFMLLTRRINEERKRFIPRGVVTLPMVSPEIAKEYQVIKSFNIKQFEREISSSWKKEIEEINNFSETFYKDLMLKDSKGKWKPKPKLLMKTYFYDYFGKNRYVDEQVNMFVLRIKDYVSNECEKLNVENEKLKVENEKLNNVEVVL